MRKLALDDDILLNIEKPARYIGGEVNAVMKEKELEAGEIAVRFAMCFPDVYEIGMSHLGIQILYDMFNRREDVWCERVYSPWMDLDKIMREQDLPLFTLESQDPVRSFDFLGITIQFEMCYTNILQILELSHIPPHSSDRTLEDPFVIGGGPCTYNPEPLAEFFDLFYIGEGETVYDELLDAYKEWKGSGRSRTEFLERAAQIEGIYVPSFYEAEYHEDGTLKSFTPINDHAPAVVRKQIVMDVTDAPYPQKPVVPFIKATQDRVVLEIQRGCIRGCRFCQAGMLYRPTRERNVDRLKEYAHAMLKNTGHSRQKEAQCLEDILTQDVDGLIIEPSKSQILCRNMPLYEQLDRMGIPYVFIQGSYLQMKNKPTILLDDAKGAYLLTKYLIDTGHRQIAGVFKADDSQGAERHKGYVKARQEAGMSYQPELVVWFHTEDRKVKPAVMVQMMLEAELPIDAVVCYNDQIAVEVIRMLERIGKKVPKDLSVTGYDDSMIARTGPVELTTVSHPQEKLGEMAAELLLELLHGIPPEESRVLRLIEPELVIRKSCMERR